LKVQRIDHVSFTVGDLDRSIRFYARFGLEPFKRYVSAGPEVDDGTDTPNADIDIAWLRQPGERVMLELLRYNHQPADRAAHNSKVGAAHICFAVEDVLGAYERLSADGIQFLSAPHQDAFGVRWVYLRDPDGNAVELIQDPPAASAE
jgi:catechol 2,3-dioxygenase-like lactoylglutathione lyase family enzyme